MHVLLLLLLTGSTSAASPESIAGSTSTSEDMRIVSLESFKRELKRRSSFSFAVMDMLKTDAVTKLCFLQV